VAGFYGHAVVTQTNAGYLITAGFTARVAEAESRDTGVAIPHPTVVPAVQMTLAGLHKCGISVVSTGIVALSNPVSDFSAASIERTVQLR
jgi:hypothetical protein